MTTAVRIFSHAGVVSVPVANQQLQGSDQTLVMLKQPYLGADALSCETGSADASEVSAAPRSTALLLVEVENGKTVHYEVTPTNSDLRTATNASPTLTGHRTISFGEGWRISVLEAA